VRLSIKEAGLMTRCASVLAGLLLLVACNAGGSAFSPVASPTPSAADPTPVPPGPTPTPGPPANFEPPSAECPAPPDPVVQPDVVVSVGGSEGIVATRGPSLFTTCSIASSSDTVSSEPPTGVTARPGDALTLALPPGWVIVYWEGFDRPVVGEGANVWPGMETLDRPGRIKVPVPLRTGDSIAGYLLWVVRADQRVVGRIEILVRVTVR
jgi:hypothetical protein